MSNKSNQGSFIEFLKSKAFVKQLLYIVLGFGFLIFAIQLWLSFYTNHGQKLELPEFVGMEVSAAQRLADERDFEIVVNDSVFVVGKAGGFITDQNPKPKSLVKEKRKIYVTVTKYGTETIKVSDLPILYGNAFDQKKTELKYRDLESNIKGYAYDPGEPDHILEVYYNEELIISRDIKKNDLEIPKGAQLDFILSKQEGGDVVIPDLRCLDTDEARFMLESSKLLLGDIIRKATVEPDAIMYVVSQSPPYDGISNIKMGEKINITVSSTKPSDCQ
ncbi:MAG: PASTA domain-containing protein [Saprospiraceae bacterium]